MKFALSWAMHVSTTRFILDFSTIVRHLCKLLAKETLFIFDEEFMKAFGALKRILTSTPIIRPPNWGVPFEIMCDASDYAVGAVLGQRVVKLHHVIYYASRIMYKNKVLAIAPVVCSKVCVQVRGRSIGNCVL